MTVTAGKTDIELKMDVLAELNYDPSIKVADIGVLVDDGVVTLNGRASSHGEKLTIVRAAKRVSGVMAIADEIEVDLPDFDQHSDSEIAAAAANRIAWTTEIPAGTVEVTVRNGHIMLEGVLGWGYQKSVAENVVQNLPGVKGISNLITIRPASTTVEIGTEIRAALGRSALLANADIHVETSGNGVMLSGKVHNHAELEEALRIAWAAPGVHTVDSQIKVNWFWGLVD